jgi:hypothetical protein
MVGDERWNGVYCLTPTTMATRNQKQLEQDRIKDLRNRGLGNGTFYCQPCDHYGWDRHGALKKHNKSNVCISKHQLIANNQPILPQLAATLQPVGLNASATITPMSLTNQPGPSTATCEFPHSHFDLFLRYHQIEGLLFT